MVNLQDEPPNASWMKKHMRYLFIILLLLVNLTACHKERDRVTGSVEIHLLDAYETVGDTPEIDLASAVVAGKPLLEYQDLKVYNAKNYFFRITDDAREAVQEMDQSVSGIPFGVTADDELVYTGYFVPSYSSASVQWIVIDPLFIGTDNRMYVQLGYPGQFEGSVIPDQRNDPRILDIFRRDGKLVE
jgi:hypothetical protein